jgi:thioredoxin-like negative regulator of GroEL
MAYPSPSAYLLSAHGEFAWHLQDDVQLAERQFRAAIALSPRDVQARQHLVDLLISTGKLAEARVELDALGKMNTFGMFNRLITELNDELHAKEASPAS